MIAKKYLLCGKTFYLWHKPLIDALVKAKLIEYYEDKFVEDTKAFLVDKEIVTFNNKPIEYDPLSKTFVNMFDYGNGHCFGILYGVFP